MREKKISVFCPICDRKLLRTKGTEDTEVCCPRCKVNLVIYLNEEGLHVREDVAEYKAI